MITASEWWTVDSCVDGDVGGELHDPPTSKKKKKVWEMKRSDWSILKSYWLKPGRHGKSIMIHQWLPPQQVSRRCDNHAKCNCAKKKTQQLSNQTQSIHFRWLKSKSVFLNAFSLLSHLLKDERLHHARMISASQNGRLDDSADHLFFVLSTLACCWKKVRDKDLSGQGSKSILCTEQSSVKRQSSGWRAMSRSSICHVTEYTMKSL